MGMFLNYQNLADNYMPNNLMRAFPKQHIDSKLCPVEASKPFEEYNTKGELTGYFWRYGETLNLEFNIDGEITVESDAIVIDTKGYGPSAETVGNIGRRCYNVIDLVSWTCTAVMDGEYVWTKDEEFTYPDSSTRSVYISAEDYLKYKKVEVTIYNFRMEPICTKVYDASPKIIFHIDKELSKSLFRGIYYCSVVVFDDDVSFNIFDSTDCNLLVK